MLPRCSCNLLATPRPAVLPIVSGRRTIASGRPGARLSSSASFREKRPGDRREAMLALARPSRVAHHHGISQIVPEIADLRLNVGLYHLPAPALDGLARDRPRALDAEIALEAPVFEQAGRVEDLFLVHRPLLVPVAAHPAAVQRLGGFTVVERQRDDKMQVRLLRLS